MISLNLHWLPICTIGILLSTDIDECAEQLDECQQVCNNTIGSYVCDCRIGYALNSDGRTCRGKTNKYFRMIAYTIITVGFPFQILMNVHLELIAVIRTVTITLAHTRAAVMQAGVLTLMGSAAMVWTKTKFDNHVILCKYNCRYR